MSQQYNKVEKRKRRLRYLRRHKKKQGRTKATAPASIAAP